MRLAHPGPDDQVVVLFRTDIPTPWASDWSQNKTGFYPLLKGPGRCGPLDVQPRDAR